jgi:ERO1-like protein beta
LTAIQKFRIAVNTGDESVLGIEGTLPLSAKEAPSADFDDFEGLDDDPGESNETKQAYTLAEEFWGEFDPVYRAFKHIINSWIAFPFQASAILIMEVQRLWNYWLGLPVRPRS